MARQLEFWEDGKPGENTAAHPPESPFEDEGERNRLRNASRHDQTERLPQVPLPKGVPRSGGGCGPPRHSPTAPSALPVVEGGFTEQAARDGKTLDPATIETLRAELCRLSGLDVFVKITNNSHCMMRVAQEPGGGSARLSVHWMFLDAPQAVVKALAAWVKSPRKLLKDSVLRCYMRENNDRIPVAAPRRVTIYTKGRHYDLAELYADVNAAEFDGAINSQITWGVMLPVGGSRSGHFRLGSYNDARSLIRIHPVLDHPEVPRFVIRSIVFHEMLHASLGIKKEDGKRRKVHHSEFKRREEQYADFKAAEAWINNPQNMRMLARIRRNGRGT